MPQKKNYQKQRWTFSFLILSGRLFVKWFSNWQSIILTVQVHLWLNSFHFKWNEHFFLFIYSFCFLLFQLYLFKTNQNISLILKLCCIVNRKHFLRTDYIQPVNRARTIFNIFGLWLRYLVVVQISLRHDFKSFSCGLLVFRSRDNKTVRKLLN